MTKQQERVCELLCDFGREEILKFFRPDSCIASTKVAIKVLAHFRINAQPLAVDLEVLNPIFHDKQQKIGRRPETDEEAQEWLKAGAWSVAIDTGKTNLGHVVAIVMNDFLLDMSLDQATRLHKGMVLRAGGGPVPGNFFRNGGHVSYGCNGCYLSYWAQPDNQVFRTSNDWRIGARTQPATKAIIRRIERAL